MAKGYSHIVIGAGAIGSAAAYWLSERGADRVLVLEQFDLVNALGSSGDHSRIIRHAYHRVEYTRLTHAMFDAWGEIERRSGSSPGPIDPAHPTARGWPPPGGRLI